MTAALSDIVECEKDINNLLTIRLLPICCRRLTWESSARGNCHQRSPRCALLCLLFRNSISPYRHVYLSFLLVPISDLLATNRTVQVKNVAVFAPLSRRDYVEAIETSIATSATLLDATSDISDLLIRAR
jgi:hypothetical protein